MSSTKFKYIMFYYFIPTKLFYTNNSPLCYYLSLDKLIVLYNIFYFITILHLNPNTTADCPGVLLNANIPTPLVLLVDPPL